jgi:glycosyltransferase involved in cell wall biosynthesis
MDVTEGGIGTRIPYQLLQSAKIATESEGFDVVHNSYFDSFFMTPFSAWLKCPLVTTVHSDFWQFPNTRSVLEKTQREQDALVFVSKKARELAGNPKNAHVVYNGINIAQYQFKPKNEGDYILWLSRISRKKGAGEAVQVALNTGKELILSGNYPLSKENIEYFEERVKKFFSEKVRYTGASSLEEKVSYYQNAKVFLFPIQWEEPFGLVMIEAMACGTPVIAFARGAVPEIIVDGVTGFIVNPSDDDIRGNWIIKKTGVGGLQEAVEKISNLSKDDYVTMRQACRKHVEDNFTVEKMVDGYEKVYRKIIEASR